MLIRLGITRAHYREFGALGQGSSRLVWSMQLAHGRIYRCIWYHEPGVLQNQAAAPVLQRPVTNEVTDAGVAGLFAEPGEAFAAQNLGAERRRRLASRSQNQDGLMHGGNRAASGRPVK